MSNSTIPRIGSSKLVDGLEKIVQIVSYNEKMTMEQLKEEMNKIDEANEKNLFSSPEEWLSFTLESKNRSLKILREKEGYMELTTDGKKLIEAQDFERELFNQMVSKSSTNFRYFYEVIEEVDHRVKAQNNVLGEKLQEEVNRIMSGNNRVTAGAIKAFLKDFRIVNENSSKWVIDSSRYSYLKDDKEDMLKGVLNENDGVLTYAKLQDIFLNNFEWSLSEFEDEINSLKRKNDLMVDKMEGKKHVFLDKG